MLTAKEIELMCKENNVRLVSTYRGEGSVCTVVCNKCGHKWKSGLHSNTLDCPNCPTYERIEKIQDEEIRKTIVQESEKIVEQEPENVIEQEYQDKKVEKTIIKNPWF